MSRTASRRAAPIAALVLITVAVACRDDASTPTAPGLMRPNPAATTAASRQRDSVPDGTAIGTLSTALTLPRTKYRAEYHNGIVKTGASNVYFIWYGTWSTPDGLAAQQLLGEMVATLGNSPYMRIATLYPDANGARPSGGLVYSGAAYDVTYSHGATLSPTDVADVVTQTILTGALPLDLKGIYLVLASADVSSPGYATNFCAFHRDVNIVGALAPYALIIDPRRAPSSCAPQMLGPNGTLGADAMASLLVAELFDSITDGHFTGYYDRLAFEPASKCAWTYGTTYTAPNGAKANINVGGHHLLLQQLWVPSKSGGACGMSVPASATAAVSLGQLAPLTGGED